VLAARLLTDMNGNRSEIAFDALGFVAGLAVKGKSGEHAGDTLEAFEPDPPPSQLQAFLAHPHAFAAALLGGATTRTLYDVERHLTSREPAFTAAIARETHV